MHWSRIAVVAASCVLATACTAAPQPSPTPTPTPTYSCTPEAGGTSYECSQFDYEQMVAKDRLYAEAEAVYRKFFAENVRIYESGGVSQPTSVLTRTTTGRFLSDTMELYRALNQRQARIVEGSPRLKSLTRLPDITREGSVVTLAACVDSTDVVLRGNAGYESRGRVISERLYFSQVDGGLKIQGSQWKELQSC